MCCFILNPWWILRLLLNKLMILQDDVVFYLQVASPWNQLSECHAGWLGLLLLRRERQEQSGILGTYYACPACTVYFDYDYVVLRHNLWEWTHCWCELCTVTELFVDLNRSIQGCMAECKVQSADIEWCGFLIQMRSSSSKADFYFAQVISNLTIDPEIAIHWWHFEF